MIALEPLNEIVYPEYRDQLLQRYADSIADAWEVSTAQAAEFARVQVSSLLPNGVFTQFHQLRQIWKGHELAGVVWFSNQPGSIAYVYDLFVEEEYRRQGVGRETLRLIEKEVLDQGCFAISLHVFTSNVAAHNFYNALGLKPIGTQLFKNLHCAGAA